MRNDKEDVVVELLGFGLGVDFRIDPCSGGGFPDEKYYDSDSLPAGQHQRSYPAAGVADHEPVDGRVGDRGKPSWREWFDGSDQGCGFASGWLHRADGNDWCARHQSVDLPETAVFAGKGFRAGNHCRSYAQYAGRESECEGQ